MEENCQFDGGGLELNLDLDLDLDYKSIELRHTIDRWATEWEMSLIDGVHQCKDSEQDGNVSWALHCFPQKSQAKELLQAGLDRRDQFLHLDAKSFAWRRHEFCR